MLQHLTQKYLHHLEPLRVAAAAAALAQVLVVVRHAARPQPRQRGGHVPVGATWQVQTRAPQPYLKWSNTEYIYFAQFYLLLVIMNRYCEAQGKGRAKGRPRKVTQKSFM